MIQNHNYIYTSYNNDIYYDIIINNMGHCGSFKKPNKKEEITTLTNNNNKQKYTDNDICGILNIGNNCYFNSGLQIIASCKELIEELNKIKNTKGKIILYLKNAIDELLHNKIYNPEYFLNYFCQKNYDFIKGIQCSSQDFIRTLIRNINSECLSEYNEYNTNNFVVKKINSYPQGKDYSSLEEFIKNNNLYIESKIQSLFSGITKSYSQGTCIHCLNTIKHISYDFFIDINIYLDSINGKQNFSDILKSNFGILDDLTIECKNCHRENVLKSKTCFIKIPDILIFTLERNVGKANNVEIEPNEIIIMDDYLDNNLKTGNYYELFAINIKLGNDINFGHEICQVKRNNIWYEIDDTTGRIINNKSYYDSSYGLFYRKI